MIYDLLSSNLSIAIKELGSYSITKKKYEKYDISKYEIQYREYVDPSGKCGTIPQFGILDQFFQLLFSRIYNILRNHFSDLTIGSLEQFGCWHSSGLVDLWRTFTVVEPSNFSERHYYFNQVILFAT